jgi:hypothetical protein
MIAVNEDFSSLDASGTSFLSPGILTRCSFEPGCLHGDQRCIWYTARVINFSFLAGLHVSAAHLSEDLRLKVIILHALPAALPLQVAEPD